MLEKNMPLVSVIVPVYNAEKFLRDTLDAIVGQTYKNLEIICVNDCSKDNSLNILNDYAKNDNRIVVIDNEKNLKVAKTRNKAIDIANGKYIAFCDADDIWLNNKLEKQIDLMEKNGYDLTFTSVEFIDSIGNDTGKQFVVSKNVDYKTLLPQNVITLSSAVIKRDTLGALRFHNDEIHEDFIMWLELLKGKIDKAYAVSDILVKYRLTEGSKSRNKWKSLKMTYKVYRFFKINWIKSHFLLAKYVIRGLKKYK